MPLDAKLDGVCGMCVVCVWCTSTWARRWLAAPQLGHLRSMFMAVDTAGGEWRLLAKSGLAT